jgi:fatty-acyl-CoA synthase
LGVKEIMTGYGMTESGAGVTMSRPEDDLAVVMTSVGSVKYAGTAGLSDAPTMLAELKTVDLTNGKDLEPGAEGEIVVRSDTLMSGFWNKPNETDAVFDGTWLRTGDVGRIRSDGQLELTGRTKELYKSGGELVMPKEVEEVIEQIPGVNQSFVIGLPDDTWGEIGCAVILSDPGAELSAEDVIHACRAKLARFKVPKKVIFLNEEDLPLTASGKIQKAKLRDDVVPGLIAPTATSGKVLRRDA